MPCISLIDEVSQNDCQLLLSGETLTNQNVATIKYLKHLDSIAPIYKAIKKIKDNLEDIADEKCNVSCEIRMFEVKCKTKMEDKFFTPCMKPTKKRISRLLLPNSFNPIKNLAAPNNDLVAVASQKSSNIIKSSLFRFKKDKLIECQVVLQRKYLTITDLDTKETQVFTLLYAYLMQENNITLDGHIYYPISIYCTRLKSITLYCSSQSEQKMWSSYFNGSQSKSISEQYDVQKQIHKGINCTLHLAVNKSTGEKVVIKEIQKNPTIEQSQLKNQVDVLNMLKHPHIVELLDVVEIFNSVSLIFKYLEGPDLSICLTKPFPDALIRTIIYAISSALFSLKDNGIVHRDIQLSNIMFSKNDLASEVKLISFSLLGLCINGEFLDGVKGSLRFVAPEIISQRKCNYRADVWSLGVVFYAMLSTKLPFEGDSANDVMKSILNNEPDYNKGELKNRPQESINLLKRMLIKDPAGRIDIENVLLDSYLSNGKEIDVNPQDKMKMYRLFSNSLKCL
jgi:tRNA A-37 threonylcarbamoyl transferase component Bud32